MLGWVGIGVGGDGVGGRVVDNIGVGVGGDGSAVGGGGRGGKGVGGIGGSGGEGRGGRGGLGVGKVVLLVQNTKVHYNKFDTRMIYDFFAALRLS